MQTHAATILPRVPDGIDSLCCCFYCCLFGVGFHSVIPKVASNSRGPRCSETRGSASKMFQLFLFVYLILFFKVMNFGKLVL